VFEAALQKQFEERLLTARMTINFDRLMDGLWMKVDECKREQKEADG
jgi:hypothetical protein